MMIDVQSCEMVALMQTLLIHFRFGQFIELNIILEFLFFLLIPGAFYRTVRNPFSFFIFHLPEQEWI